MQMWSIFYSTSLKAQQLHMHAVIKKFINTIRICDNFKLGFRQENRAFIQWSMTSSCSFSLHAEWHLCHLSLNGFCKGMKSCSSDLNLSWIALSAFFYSYLVNPLNSVLIFLVCWLMSDPVDLLLFMLHLYHVYPNVYSIHVFMLCAFVSIVLFHLHHVWLQQNQTWM